MNDDIADLVRRIEGLYDESIPAPGTAIRGGRVSTRGW